MIDCQPLRSVFELKGVHCWNGAVEMARRLFVFLCVFGCRRHNAGRGENEGAGRWSADPLALALNPPSTWKDMMERS